MPAGVPPFTRNETWAAIFSSSYLAWFLMELWIRLRDRRKPDGEDADRGSAPLISLMILIAIAGAFAAPFLVPWGRTGKQAALLFYGAIGMIWGGMAFRLWAVLTLGRFFRTSVLVHDDHTLVARGPYRVLRHPSYTGLIVTLAGIGLVMGNWM